LSKHKNLQTLVNYVKTEPQKVANWFLANNIAINTSKTKFILFRTQGKQIDENISKIFYNNNEIGKLIDQNLIFNIERIHNAGHTKNFKLLGIMLDEYLSFVSHINLLSSKIAKSLYINRVKNTLPKDSLVTLYYALIHSHISYCTSVYGSATPTSLSKLVVMQKKAIRTICNVPSRSHTAPLFKELKILPLEKLILYSKLKFIHNFVHNRLPCSFNETWIQNRERNPRLNLRNVQDLYIKPINYISIKRLPLFTFPSLWNQEHQSKSIPESTKCLRSLKIRLLNEIII